MKRGGGKLTEVLVLLVLALYSLLLLAVLLGGARLYRQLTDDSALGHQAATAVQYLTTRVRQADQAEILPFGEGQALVLRLEEEPGYETRVYVYDGYLRELYCARDALLGPEAGEKLLPAQSLELEREENRIWIRIDSRQILLTKEAWP